MKVINDIETAKNIINSDFDLTKPNFISQLYPFTTENIKGYFDLFDFTNKDILTVESSGDQVLNLYLKNINSVDLFDINPYSKYYFELKKAAIKTLELDEFIEYFCYIEYPTLFKTNLKVFNKEIYNRIKVCLYKEARYFWDNMYLENSGFDIRSSNLFSKDEERYTILKEANIYMRDKEYYILKEILNTSKDPEFYNENINELELEKKYDVIMLSNIAQYIENIYKKEHLKKFKETITKLEQNLNNDGIILLAYLYDINHISYLLYEPQIYNLEKVKKYFENIEILKFKGIENLKFHQINPIKDGIIVYKKTKN